MTDFLPPNTKIKYKKHIFDYVNGVFTKIKEQHKTGIIFMVEIRHDSIAYKVKKNLRAYTWEYVNPSDIIEVL